MGWRLVVRRACLALATVAVSLGGPALVQAQLFTPNAGVMVDPKGVLRTVTHPDPGLEQTRRNAAVARADLNANVAQKSAMRKISLNRLEKAIEAHLASGRKMPTDEMRFLAGLTRVEHVFFYPDTNDIVIAGPAEGWFNDLSGRVLGIDTGRPIVELQDLVTALRVYPPRGNGPGKIGCSIDATPEGLKRMQEFMRSISAPQPTDEFAQYVVEGLRTSVGLQKVRIDGVPPATHFAQVMVEADYRMKLIGIGLEIPPVKITSYVDRAQPGRSYNAMQRWWFVPDYKCVRVSEDELAMQLVGDGVKLLNEDEVVGSDGQRGTASGRVDRAGAEFVLSFTRKYPELAAKSQVFGQLRNLIDLSIVAAFIQQHDFYGRADWKMPFLSSEDKFAVETYQAPVEVETAVAVKWKGSRLMTPVGGGVTLHPELALSTDNLLADDGGKVKAAREQADIKKLPADKWWWD